MEKLINNIETKQDLRDEVKKYKFRERVVEIENKHQKTNIIIISHQKRKNQNNGTEFTFKTVI